MTTLEMVKPESEGGVWPGASNHQWVDETTVLYLWQIARDPRWTTPLAWDEVVFMMDEGKRLLLYREMRPTYRGAPDAHIEYQAVWRRVSACLTANHETPSLFGSGTPRPVVNWGTGHVRIVTADGDQTNLFMDEKPETYDFLLLDFMDGSSQMTPAALMRFLKPDGHIAFVEGYLGCR